MTSGPRRRATGFVVVLAALVGAIGCSAEGDATGGAAPTSSVPRAEVEAAADRASRFVLDNIDALDPMHLSTLDYLYRKWDVEPFASAAALASSGFDAVVDGRAPRWEYGDTRQILGMGRLVEPDRREPPSRRSDTAEIEILLGGLYCDSRPLTDDDLALWREESQKGGYDATHVLLAWSWARDIGCEVDGADSVIAETADIVRSEFLARYGGDPAPADIDDLGLEQAVFLEIAGQEGVMTSSWIEAVLGAQQPDGGWALAVEVGRGPAESHWHATVLALWALLLYSGDGADESWVQV